MLITFSSATARLPVTSVVLYEKIKDRDQGGEPKVSQCHRMLC